jgi:hypothetical protein
MGIGVSILLIKLLGLTWVSATIFFVGMMIWEIHEFMHRNQYVVGYEDTLVDLSVGLIAWVLVATYSNYQ